MTDNTRRHIVGRHLMQHEDGATWCRRCGAFDVYCRDDGEPTECKPKPRQERWWKRIRKEVT